MMKLTIDLISDLHVETWPEPFDWQGRATSQVCIVAGDVARDPTVLKQTLTHLSKCYQGVFYIDGNEEHKHNWIGIGDTTREIEHFASQIPNLVYLHNNVVVTDGVAIVGTNGWWSWDFNSSIEEDQTKQWFENSYHAPKAVSSVIDHLAQADMSYLYQSISTLQTRKDVKKIIVVTHTVPGVEFVEHDISLNDSYRINILGNNWIRHALDADTENKVSHWCFGHYHGSVDRTINGVRYINNCRGRGDTDHKQIVYHPLRLEFNI